jgi:hypothetical protein
VANNGFEANPSITVYPPLANSAGLPDEAPTATISAAVTSGIFVDSSGIYVTNRTSVALYPSLNGRTGIINE